MTCEEAIKLIDDRTPEEKRNGLCPCCNEHKNTVLCRRQNTAYIDEISNFVIVCEECFEDIEAYWKERWDEYYGTVNAGIRAGNIAEKI